MHFQLYFIIQQAFGQLIDPLGHPVEGKNQIPGFIPGNFPGIKGKGVAVLTVHMFGKPYNVFQRFEYEAEDNNAGAAKNQNRYGQAEQKRLIGKIFPVSGVTLITWKMPLSKEIALMMLRLFPSRMT